jgi:low affinity Fe/Cu permease
MAKQKLQQSSESHSSYVDSAFHTFFRRFSAMAAGAVGSASAFVLALLTVLAWAITGPIFHYSDTWQLVINTATTVVTFLMVFLIQNTQNRDAKAIHLKLDELIRAVHGARNRMVNVEDMTDEELALLQKQFHRLNEQTQPVDEVANRARHQGAI